MSTGGRSCWKVRVLASNHHLPKATQPAGDMRGTHPLISSGTSLDVQGMKIMNLL